MTFKQGFMMLAVVAGISALGWHRATQITVSGLDNQDQSAPVGLLEEASMNHAARRITETIPRAAVTSSTPATIPSPLVIESAKAVSSDDVPTQVATSSPPIQTKPETKEEKIAKVIPIAAPKIRMLLQDMGENTDSLTDTDLWQRLDSGMDEQLNYRYLTLQYCLFCYESLRFAEANIYNRILNKEEYLSYAASDAFQQIRAYVVTIRCGDPVYSKQLLCAEQQNVN